jgi:glucose-6-phosphate 1-dehydrogenase
MMGEMQNIGPAGPCVLVIFGASGDLTKRLLMPAICHLKRAKLLPDAFAVVGVARSDQTPDAFRERLRSAVQQFAKETIDQDDWDWLAQRMQYLSGNVDNASTYQRLKTLLQGIDGKAGTGGNYLFYFAIPESEFAGVVGQLGATGLVRETPGSWRRVVIEKPFGMDLQSARKLNHLLWEHLDESQVFRIDHYLGKETVQNIMVLRFANGMLEPLWNRNHIDHVQITVAETIGVESRGNFYDATGALRDMVPNHLFQVLTLIAMEPPSCFEANATRNEKGKVLDAIRSFSPEAVRRDVVRAQYSAGTVDGKAMPDYWREQHVSPVSSTETYVALRLTIDNWRWAGVPFYLRTGKALAAKKSEVIVRFKQPPLTLFRDTPVEKLTTNDLILMIQPEEGVSLRFGAKVPGPMMRIGDVEMKFNYSQYFRAEANNGYETLLYDCMIGDASLFQRADNIEAAWRIIQPILDDWAGRGSDALPVYPAGSQGPAEAGALIERDGRRWHPLIAPGRHEPN